MSFFIFKCQDPVTKELIKTFNATPLTTPDSFTQPLQVIAHRGKETANWGPIKELLIDKSKFKLELQKNAAYSDVDIKKTNNFGIDLGLKILGEFFKGFDLKIEPLEIALKSTKKIALSFKEVQKRYIPITTLGSAFIPVRINRDHPAFQVFVPKKGKRVYDMYLITGVLTCGDFDIIFDKTQNNKVELEAPVLEQLTDVGITSQFDSTYTKALSFHNDNKLTFAFTCIELNVDEEGNVNFGREVILKKGMDENGKEVIEKLPEEVSLINESLPGMLKWDDKERILQLYENS